MDREAWQPTCSTGWPRTSWRTSYDLQAHHRAHPDIARVPAGCSRHAGARGRVHLPRALPSGGSRPNSSSTRISAVTGVWQDAPAGDFDFTIAGTQGVPAPGGRWIAPRQLRAHGARSGYGPTVSRHYASPGRCHGWHSARTGSRSGGRAGRDPIARGHQGTGSPEGTFSLPVLPATAHVLAESARTVRMCCTVNGHAAAEQEAPAVARLVDVRPHLQRGRNVLAVAVGAPPFGRAESGCGAGGLGPRRAFCPSVDSRAFRAQRCDRDRRRLEPRLARVALGRGRLGAPCIRRPTVGARSRKSRG